MASAVLLIVALTATALIAACGSPPQPLTSMLPLSVEGAPVRVSAVTPDAPLSGVPADDVLAALKKGRGDAVIAMGEWAGGVVTLMTVADVTPQQLLAAAVAGWHPGAPEVPPGRGIPGDVRVVDAGAGRSAYMRIVGTAVAIVETASADQAAVVFASLGP